MWPEDYSDITFLSLASAGFLCRQSLSDLSWFIYYSYVVNDVYFDLILGIASILLNKFV